MDNYGFSAETREWLSGWLSGGKEVINLPDIVVKETSRYINYDNDIQLKLYKAVTDNDLLDIDTGYGWFEYTSSWTHSLDIAHRFKSHDKPIISVVVGNSSILIDTVELDPNYIIKNLGGYPEEHEVILLPGRYRIEIIAQ